MLKTLPLFRLTQPKGVNPDRRRADAPGETVALLPVYGTPNTTPFGYHGSYSDPATNLTAQLYNYTGGDPVNGSDPLGLWWCHSLGVEGSCPKGFTPGPPYNMGFPQPPGSCVTSLG